MQKAQTDDKGTEIAYIDSGALPGLTNYSTMVIVHGYTYHASKLACPTPIVECGITVLQQRASLVGCPLLE